MENLKMHSLDGVQRNIELIGKLFPNAITEVKRDGKVEHAIDFDVLRQELSDSIVEGREERYQFTWPDKKKAMLAANAPITATLRPVVADSVGKDGTPGGFDSENLYIEGDNLEVLKLLQETYLGKIKMIYIVILTPILMSILSSENAQRFNQSKTYFTLGSPNWLA